jgi:hypothetical protein
VYHYAHWYPLWLLFIFLAVDAVTFRQPRTDVPQSDVAEAGMWKLRLESMILAVKACLAALMRRFVNQVNQTGNLAYLTARNNGHDTHTLAMRNDKIVAWLVEQDRTKATPPPGLPIYPHNSPWKPFLLFALPILLSIPLAILQIVRRWQAFLKTRKN